MTTINEFTDWLSGVDYFNNKKVSDELFTEYTDPNTGETHRSIKGAFIRELLQSRLKQPFIIYDDEEGGLYRMFSSEVARDRWISLNNPQDPNYNPELAEELKLEIFNFERPSEFILSTDLSSDPRYIIKGDTAASESEIEFKVSLKE